MVQNHHLAVPHHALVPCRKKSLLARGGNVSLHDNLIIHGDNLAALKSLLPTYGGKVNCVCIDPPYNTGNENWIYSDRVSNPMMQEWLGKVVDREDLTRHDKWLCMMMPRLKLLHELLAEDGVIFVFIDDNELHRLRMLMDDIFGEDNFIADFIWHHRKSSQNDIDISLSHNYILSYAKHKDSFAFNSLRVDESKFTNPDNDPRGPWVADPMDAPNIRPNLTYPIVNPNTKKTYMPPAGRCWRFGPEKYESALKDNRIVFGKLGKTKPQFKRFLSEAKDKGVNVFTIWGDVGTATDGTKELMTIFNGKKVFPTVKPSDLVQKILRIATDENSIVLDSFAGSGTTAHAVLELNKEDVGNRQFILVECEDYADSITAERIRRVIRGVKTARNENLQEGLGGTFSYFQLGKPIKMTSILHGDNLPSYDELARFVFYTATGEEWNPAKMKKRINCIGDSKEYAAIYLFYQPDVEKLKNLSLTLKQAKELPSAAKGGRRLVFAPTKFINDAELRKLRIDFCRLPFEIYKMAR